MGLINQKYNSSHSELNGRFCFLEAYDDKEVLSLLINEIETWLKKEGMKNIVGPLGISDKDPQGFLVEGFDEPAVIVTNCNFPYLVEFIREAGYEKKSTFSNTEYLTSLWNDLRAVLLLLPLPEPRC